MKKGLKKLWLAVMGMMVVHLVPAVAMASEAVAKEGTRDGDIALAAGLAIGIAAVGGAIGQGLTGFKAMEAFGRNPGASDKILTPMILALALTESLVIYALIIAFVLTGKISG